MESLTDPQLWQHTGVAQGLAALAVLIVIGCVTTAAAINRTLRLALARVKTTR